MGSAGVKSARAATLIPRVAARVSARGGSVLNNFELKNNDNN